MMRTILFASLGAEELRVGENTFRAGDKWADLKIGEVVKLGITSDPEACAGNAIVRGVVSDCLDILLDGHAHRNHGFVHGPQLSTAELDLRDVLVFLYGPQEGHETFTVVYLDRVLP